MTTNPLFITSTASLATASRKLHNVNPLLGISRNYIWAKGPPSTLVKALEAPGLDIAYVTSIDAFRKDPQILLATRTYSYVRTVALAAALIALAGLVLYLQARSQTQRIASALARRMGLSAGSEILSLFLELAAILLASAVVGIGVAAAVAAPIVKHVDLLPDFVPSSRRRHPLERRRLPLPRAPRGRRDRSRSHLGALAPDRRQRGSPCRLSRSSSVAG